MTTGIKKNVKKTFLYSHCGLLTVTSFSRIFRGGRAPPWLGGVRGMVCGAQTDHIDVLPLPAALPAPAPRNWLGATRSR